MPRQPRAFVPGGTYHVYTQGSDRRPLFLFDVDRTDFLGRLAVLLARYELTCIAYCLMGNHYHLVVRTPDARLSRAVQHLHTGYSTQFNRMNGRRAHLFRNRFGARLIESDPDLLGVGRYPAYNPVKAGLCGDPIDWPWSSYRASVGIDRPPPFLSDEAIGEAIGGGPNWRARYRAFVESWTLADDSADDPFLSRHS